MKKMLHSTKAEFLQIGFVLFAMCLLGSIYPLLLNSTYKGSPDIHATIELVGALIGVLAGIVLVIHFYVLGNRFYLLVGLAFFINGAEDFAHGLISFRNLFSLPPEHLTLAIPATYVTGRILMGIILIAAPFANTWFAESEHPKRETVWMSVLTIVVSLILTYWAFHLSLPNTIRPEAFIPRPLDFLSAIILFIALVAFIRLYLRDRSILTWWILLSIGVNIVGQLIMSFSRSISDPFFDIAHVYKVLGYIAPVLGFSLYQIATITQNKKAAEELNAVNQQLLASIEKEKELAAAAATAKAETKRANELYAVNQQLAAKEEAMRESEEKHRQLIENSHDIIYTLTTDGVFTFVSPAWTVLLGHPVIQVVGHPFQPFVHPDDLPGCMAWLQKVIETGQRQEGVEYRVRHLNGSWCWHTSSAVPLRDETGIFIGFEGTARDITDRKQAEDALRESETSSRTLIENSFDVIFSLDAEGTFIFVSPSWELHFGYPVSEVMGMNFASFVHPDDIKPCIEYLMVVMGTGQSGTSPEYRVRHADGSWRCFIANGSPYVDLKGQRQFMGTGRDITAQKIAEADKAKLEAQNRQLQKTESLSRMAAAIAHHFNNQLGVVIGNLEMAIDEQPKGGPPAKSLTAAMQAAWKSADMSRLMLTYLGQSRDKVEPLDISYSCGKILPILKAAMPGNVILETDFSSPGPVISTSHDYIQQILTNLLTNAWESVGDDRGTISLNVKTVSPATIPTAHRFPVDWKLPDNPCACLEVIDTGSGIATKDIEQLFDPFYSTKFTGRGMGLAVVQGLVSSHKGVITVDSKPGRGSTFRVFFPLSEEALPQPQMAENDRDITISAPSPKKLEEGGTVLLIEDEEPLRKMVAIMLERLGFSVLEAKDGIDALEVFGNHQSEIKFVLTDLTMPRMNGWETLTSLRKLKPDIPVILASGYDKAHVMSGDHPELPQAFLPKPYNRTNLSDAIKQVLEKAMEG